MVYPNAVDEYVNFYIEVLERTNRWFVKCIVHVIDFERPQTYGLWFWSSKKKNFFLYL